MLGKLGGVGRRLTHFEADFAAPEAPRRLVDDAVNRFGTIDTLVLNHARRPERWRR